MVTSLPLQGIRIAVLGVAVTASGSGMVLADLGAEAIRVESTSYWPPLTRGVRARPTKEMIMNQVAYMAGYPDGEPGERPWNRWSIFNCHNRNYLSMTVNLRNPKGLELFKRLIKKTDVFIENHAADTMEKLGTTYEELIKVKPDLIMVRQPGLGLSGPYKDWRSHGAQIDALVGHELLRGYRDLDPTSSTSVFMTDYICPLHAAFAIISALHYRNRTGKGQLIEACAADSGLPTIGEAFMDYAINRRIQGTIGNRNPWSAAQGCYRCKGNDRWVNITVTTDEEWEGLCRAMGNPPRAKEEKFSNTFNRWKNHDELDRLIEEWTSQYEPSAIMYTLQNEGVPAGAVLDQRDAYEDPQFRARGFFEEVYHEDCGTHMYPGMLWKLSETSLNIRKPPVRLGEDNEYIYKKVIGVSDEGYAELEREGHIGTDVIPEIA